MRRGRTVSRSCGALAVLAASCGAPARAPAPRPELRDRLEINAGCERCHASVAAEHQSSLHARAHTDGSFVRAFEREPLAFCTGCHAPEADPNEALGTTRPFETSPALAAGVACVSCHLEKDGVRAAPLPAGVASKPAPHAIVRDRAFASPAACARCHEFTFPGKTDLMQLTMSEHRASARASTPCAECHMPVGSSPRRRDHGFSASRDPERLRSAVRVRAWREEGKLILQLAPGEIGHAFPTGDLFRRLRVSAEARDADGTLRSRSERVLSRKTKLGHLTSTDLGSTDDRPFVTGADARVELELPDGDHTIAWRVMYERVAHPLGIDEREAVVEASIEVAAGVVGANTQLAPAQKGPSLVR